MLLVQFVLYVLFVKGASNTPYSGGRWLIEFMYPDNYPFSPPLVRFLTPIYHPNIDSTGRICLDVLNLPPKGCWSPSYTVSSLLLSLQALLSDPNPNDPLMADIVCANSSHTLFLNLIHSIRLNRCFEIQMTLPQQPESTRWNMRKKINKHESKYSITNDRYINLLYDEICRT